MTTSIIIDTKVFGLTPTTRILSITSFAIIILLNIIYAPKFIKRKYNSAYLIWYVLMTYIFILGGQFVSECIIRKVSVGEWLDAIMPYGYLLLVFPVYIYLLNDQNNYLFRKIAKITFAVLICCVIAYVLFNVGIGYSIFNYFGKLVVRRNNRLRITDVTNLWPIYLSVLFVYYLVNTKISIIKRVIVGLITLVVIVYIQQTRVNILIAVICFLTSWLFMYKRGSARRVKGYLFVVGLSIALLVLGGFEFIVNSFSITGKKAASSIMRLLEIEYAIDRFKENPIFGYGITKQIIDDVIELHYLGFVFREPYSHVDIGVIGSTAMLGVFFLGIYLSPMIRYGKHFFRLIHYNGILSNSDRLYITLYIYFLLSSATLLVTDSSRIYLWPFILAFFERERNHWIESKPVYGNDRCLL